EGRLIDCKNIVFFLTSNLGYQVIVEHADNPETMQEALYPVLADFFKPALLAQGGQRRDLLRRRGEVNRHAGAGGIQHIN
ncbi:hypothetical protein ACSRCY_23310, partial [Salmonella enterica]